MDAIRATRDAEPLPSRAILAQVVHIQRIADAQDIGVGYGAFFPASTRAGVENGRRVFRPLAAIVRCRQTDLVAPARPGLIPVEELASIEQRRAVGGDVAALPGVRLRREDPALLAPMNAVRGGGQARVPRFAVECGVEIVVLAAVAHHGRIEDVYRVPVAGGEDWRGFWFPLKRGRRGLTGRRRREREVGVAIASGKAEAKQDRAF